MRQSAASAASALVPEMRPTQRRSVLPRERSQRGDATKRTLARNPRCALKCVAAFWQKNVHPEAVQGGLVGRLGAVLLCVAGVAQAQPEADAGVPASAEAAVPAADGEVSVKAPPDEGGDEKIPMGKLWVTPVPAQPPAEP